MADSDSMTEANTHTATTKAAKARQDRLVRIAFLVVIVIAGVLIYRKQTTIALPAGWRGDLDNALAQAKKEDRRVLVFFMGKPFAFDAKKMLKTTLRQPANRKAVRQGKFIKVAVVESLKSDLSRRYKIESLPTMIVLSPDGRELNRRVGFIAEVPFRTNFLSCKMVEKP